MAEIAARYISLEDAALYLGVSARTIRRRISDGVIKGYRIADSRTVRVRVDELESHMVKPLIGGDL